MLNMALHTRLGSTRTIVSGMRSASDSIGDNDSITNSRSARCSRKNKGCVRLDWWWPLLRQGEETGEGCGLRHGKDAWVWDGEGWWRKAGGGKVQLRLTNGTASLSLPHWWQTDGAMRGDSGTNDTRGGRATCTVTMVVGGGCGVHGAKRASQWGDRCVN